MRPKLVSFHVALGTLALLATTAAAQCPHSWFHRGPFCYRWFPSTQYWFQAEQTCRSYRAHLVSVGSQTENTLVGRLANCSHAWIGRFGTDLHRLSDPSAYEWTDGSDPVRFERHNFSQLDSAHKPLIRTDGDRWLNSLYNERHSFLCKLASENSTDRSCPSGWTRFYQHCYVLPHFEANFNEANFYCQRNASQLASVLTEPELAFIKRLSFGIDHCDKGSLDSVWLGLIKLNPCFPETGGRELCYQWTDFSGKHEGFPRWLPGHPQTEDWAANCAALEGDGLRSDRCYNRRRFVCKRAASNDTDGGGGRVDGVVAAFDFRRCLTNLVNSSTYIIDDRLDTIRSSENGTCFGDSFNGVIRHERKPYYIIGSPVTFNESLLSIPEWTIFFRDKDTAENNFEFILLSLANASSSASSPHYNDEFNIVLSSRFANDKGFYMSSQHLSDQHSKTLHMNAHYVASNPCALNSWCDKSMSMFRNHSSSMSIDGKASDMSAYYKGWHDGSSENLQMHLGYAYGDVPMVNYCISCLGIAHKRLVGKELAEIFDFYCPR